MFHGPAYQGIQEIVSYSDECLETTIKGVSVKGAMLDNLGQTVGLFNHFTGKSLRSFPVAVGRIDFFQNPLDQLGAFNCRCYTTGEDQDFYYSSIELKRDGRAWCKFTGWQTKKSDLDHEGWGMLNRAEGKGLAKPLTEGVFVIENSKYKQANTWFIFSHIYLNQRELATYSTLPVAKQKDRLLGRIAAKDAIRDLLLKREGRVAHPASVTIVNDPLGCPEVNAPCSDAQAAINVSIAHKKGIAVAKAAMGKTIGVDVEEIKQRDPSFIDMVVTSQERQLMPAQVDINEWITRVWVAKEAYGKSIGKGLQGSPKNYLLTAVRGDEFYIDNVGVRTLKYKQKIIGWTL
jgi:phosphopantetheinyl transferase (holo-ACP synthase)